jgi:hypothetical protein
MDRIARDALHEVAPCIPGRVVRLIEHVREHHIRERAVALSEQLPCPVDWSLTHAPTVVAARRLARAPEAIVAFGIVERVHI